MVATSSFELIDKKRFFTRSEKETIFKSLFDKILLIERNLYIDIIAVIFL
jgi:hypothetical protein